MAVSIDRELDYLQKIPGFGRYLAQALLRLRDGLNNLGTNIGADPTRTIPPPTAPQAITIKSDGNGYVHGVINDQNQINRGIRYFVEYSTDPSFKQPHVKHLGPSRSLEQLKLPEMDEDGNPQRWYFRAFSQTPSSHPSDPIAFGGEIPTPVNPGGGQMLTLLPSTGSGTGPANGQSAGQGYGKVLHRPATVNIKTAKIS